MRPPLFLLLLLLFHQKIPPARLPTKLLRRVGYRTTTPRPPPRTRLPLGVGDSTIPPLGVGNRLTPPHLRQQLDRVTPLPPLRTRLRRGVGHRPAPTRGKGQLHLGILRLASFTTALLRSGSVLARPTHSTLTGRSVHPDPFSPQDDSRASYPVSIHRLCLVDDPMVLEHELRDARPSPFPRCRTS